MEKLAASTTEAQKIPWQKKGTFFSLLFLLTMAPLLMGALCCSGNQNPFSQGNQNAGQNGPTGDRVFSQIYMLDNTHGWAITPESVLKTSDGGKSWVDLTPDDWEPAAPAGTPGASSNKPIMGISTAAFLDTNHAWILATTPIQQNDINAQQTAIPSSVSTNNGTVTVDTKQFPPDTNTIYVRSTVDGGKNWVTSNPITVKNLAGTSQLNFINPHEGWLEVETEDNNNNRTNGALFHSVDGGITWQPEIDLGNDHLFGSILCADVCLSGTTNIFGRSPLISTEGQLTGMTILPNCATNGTRQAQPCTPSSSDQTLGCTVTGTQNYVGAATGTFSSSSNGVYLNTQAGAKAEWQILAPILTPGGAPGQSRDSIILTDPPIMFTDGSGAGILPIQIQSEPQGTNRSHFFLHLYGLTPNANGLGYALYNLSTTTNFTMQLLSQSYNPISAHNGAHILAFGQDYANGDYGDWNLHEFNGHQWITLTSTTDSTIPPAAAGQQPAPLSAALSNLDMISDTEGWATNGTSVYHLAISGTTVTWSQVYPSSNHTAAASVAGSVQLVSPSRAAGNVIAAPQNPPACAAPPPPPLPIVGGNGTSNAQKHTLSFVNNTNQTIWVGANGASLPDHGNWNGKLDPGQTEKLTVSTPGANLWSGRFWGRTGCDAQGMHCDTGDCGTGGLCNGSNGALPASLAEFAFNGAAGQIYYDVSLVDGYNLPLLIHSSGGSSPDNCGNKACTDINTSCPTKLQDTNASGQVVGCKSACAAFGLDEYCCLGKFVSGVCNPDTWPADVDSAKLFKDAYPHAYSYAYDDATSTYTCDETCDFSIIFGLSATAQRTSPLDPGGSVFADRKSDPIWRT